MASFDKKVPWPASAGYQDNPPRTPSEKQPKSVARVDSAMPVELKGPRKKFDKSVAYPSSSFSSGEEEPATPLTFDPMSINWQAAFLADDLTLNESDPVATWVDSSGNSFNMTQATVSKQPTYQSANANLNGQSTVNFDGIDGRISTEGSPTWSNLSNATLFLVGRYSGGLSLTARSMIASTGDESTANMTSILHNNGWALYAGSFLGGGTTDNAPHVFEGFSDPSPDVDDYITVDGVTIATGSAGTLVHRNGLQLGGFQTSYTVEEVAFAAIIEGELTAQQKYDLGVWAEEKYGITNGYTAP